MTIYGWGEIQLWNWMDVVVKTYFECEDAVVA
jgi:hypothetical protein